MKFNIYFLFSLLAVVIVNSCSKGDCDSPKLDQQLPNCIKALVEDPKSDILKIKTQKVDGEQHYWLNTDATIVDGTEDIVDKNCNKVCYFCGECDPPECIKDYDFKEWLVIWPK